MFSIDSKLGKPTLYIDQKPVAPVLYALSDFPAAGSATAQAQRNIANFHQAGIDLVNLDIKLHVCWHKASVMDPEYILAEIANAQEANPDAKFLIRLHVNPPYWWMRDNPEECAVFREEDGDHEGIDDGHYERLIGYDGARHMRVSLASEKWLHDAGEMVKWMCDALAANPEGEAVMGIQPACGLYGEWHQWATDVSEPMKARFRRFLREKYGDDAALKKAWGDPSVTIETAPFHPETFRPGDDGNFRDPQKSRLVMDAQECMQSVSPDAILHFCKILKEKLPHVLTGAFYGYYFGTGGNNMTIGGHLQVERIFAARGMVDFMCGPVCYSENRMVDGVPMQRALLESIRLRKLLWITEMDQHTYGSDLLGVTSPENYPSSIATLRRNVLQPLLAGHGLWYFDHRVVPLQNTTGKVGSIYRKRGWWEAPEFMREIAALQRLANDITNRPYVPAADVLLVYDKVSYYCRARVEDYEYRIHEAVARTGVAYDCIYADELEVAELSRYRCVMFVNAYQITPQQRAHYRQLLSGIQTVWLYAEGYCDGDTLSVDNLSQTVGMPIIRMESAAGMHVDGEGLVEETIDIPEQTVPLFMASIDDGRPKTPGVAITPLFAAAPVEGLTVLAHYDNGQIAAAQRGQDIWIGLPLPTATLMRGLFQMCGAHSYCNAGDPIIAGAGLVAINCPKGGKRTLTLRNGQNVELTLEPCTTAVFDADSGERLL